MKNEGIHFEVSDGIGVLTVDRPKVRNSLDWAAQAAFADAVNTAAQRDAVKVLIITGQGDIFVAGGDIKDQVAKFDRETGQRLRATMGGALQQLTQMPKPVIAAINGNAYGGGCEIITACDLRLIQSTARLQFVHAKMGLTTGWGGGARLVHLVGGGRALELLLTAQPIDAQRALDFGLVTQVVAAPQSVLGAAVALAHSMCSLSGSALGSLKQMVWDSAELERGYSAENSAFLNQWDHPDHIEAVNAFLEKRKPTFE